MTPSTRNVEPVRYSLYGSHRNSIARADQNHRARNPCLDHFGGRRSQGVKRPPHRNVEGPAESIHVRLHEWLPDTVGGIGDEDVQFSEMADYPRHDLLDRLLVRDIAGNQQCLRPPVAHRPCHFFRFVLVNAIVDGHMSTGPPQCDGRRPAQPQASARD